MQAPPPLAGGLKLGKGGESAAAITLDSLNLKNVSFIKVGVDEAARKEKAARAVFPWC
jgi:hypothetical protein